MSRIIPSHPCIMITQKSTKAEILAAYSEAINRPPVTWGDLPALFSRTWGAVSREVPLFVKDCYAAGKWLRAQTTMVIEAYNQPLIKPKA